MMSLSSEGVLSGAALWLIQGAQFLVVYGFIYILAFSSYLFHFSMRVRSSIWI